MIVFAQRQNLKMTLYLSFTSLVVINLILPCTDSIENVNCIDWIHVVIYCN